jgi:hypothetical protein
MMMMMMMSFSLPLIAFSRMFGNMLITWTIRTYVLTTSLLSWIGKSSDDNHDGSGDDGDDDVDV